MKIEINHKKITSFPYSNSNTLLEVDIQDEIEQLTNRILYGNNSSILVSGYRGSGKTSSINSLRNKIKNSENKTKKYAFIHINLNKNTQYKMVLRQLIRTLYISITNENDIKENISCIKKLELIYHKTFYDVNHNFNYKNSKQNIFSIENTIDLKKAIGALGTFILSVSNIDVKNLQINDFFITLFSLMSFTYLSYKINHICKVEKLNNEEINAKSLYDDDIAEYELEEVLTQLKKDDIQCIFILDELDKIEDSDEIYKILSELKPLIFSDLATFIIICGQKLHYKYIESETLDDPFISSLFTHTIHTPLATRSQLQQVFEKYIIKNENNKDLDYDTINKYVDMLIFKSNGILRKFNNEISKELIWEDKKAFLYIDESLFNNKIDSEIVDIIENIVNDSTDVISVMKDYLTQQLYIWSKKIKYKIKFSENDILDLKEYESQSYLQPYIEEIYIWFNRLISYMISANILEREEKDGIINYKITVDAGFKNENSENSNQKSIFMKDNEVRKFVNLIDQVIMYGSILCSCINIDVNNKLDKVLISLDENKLIVRESFISYNLDDINILYESIVNNTLNEITSKHRMLIKESTHYIKNIRSFILRNIIFEYTKMRIDNNCLNIKIEKQIAKIDWAFYLVNEDEKILFKIIYRESGTKAPVIDRYNKTSKFSKIVNIVLDENIVKNDKYFYNTNITNTGRILQFNNKEYKDNIYFYDIHITREENITELLESKVWDIINEVLINDKSRLEVATTIY